MPPDPKKLGAHNAVSGPPAYLKGAVAPDEAQAPLAGPAGTASPPHALTAPPSLATLLYAFRRCWRLAVIVGALGALVAIAVAWTVVPGNYATTAVLRIPVEPEGMHILDHQKAHLSFVRSDALLDKVLAEPGVAEARTHRYTVSGLQKAMVVDFDAGRYLMRVSLSGERAEDLAALLTALGNVYPRELKTQERIRSAPYLAELKKALASAQKALEEKRGELDEPRMKKQAAAHKDRTAALGAAEDALREARRDLTAQTRERDLLQRRFQEMKKRSASETGSAASDDELDQALEKLDVFRKVKAALAKAEEDYATYDRLLAPGETRDLTLKNAREAKAVALKALAQLRQREATKGLPALESKIKDAATEVEKFEGKVRDAGLARDSAKALAAHPDATLLAIEDDVERLKRKRDRAEADFDKASAALSAGQAHLEGDVVVPREKKIDRKIKVASASGLATFGLLLVGVCLLESRTRRVYATSDVSLGLGVTVIGTVPGLPARARTLPLAGAAVLNASPASLQAIGTMTESIDALRTLLLHAPQVDGSRVVMVTSALGGEGKTTLASHLAASLARAWRKTLLIDGDLRNPGAHSQFDMPAEPGFCEGLRGEIEFEDAVRPTSLSRLWLLPAGKVDSHSLQALAQGNVGAVFERLKEQFDFIVLDTSPVLPVPDALLFGQHADAVLLAVLRDVSRVPALYAAQQRLHALGIHPLGAVVIGEKAETYGRAIPYPRPNAS